MSGTSEPNPNSNSNSNSNNNNNTDTSQTSGSYFKYNKKLIIALYELSSIYLKSPRIWINTLALFPDRFLTIAATIIAFIAVIKEFFESSIRDIFCPSCNKSAPLTETPAEFFILILAISVFTVACIILTAYLTRRDATNFTKLISDNTNSKTLVKAISAEAYLFSIRVSRYKNRRVLSLLEKNRLEYDIIEQLGNEISSRYRITRDEFYENFLRFNPEIFKNRVIKRALNFPKILDGHEKQNEKITDYCDTTKKYLKNLIHTKLELDHIEFMFRTRSASAAMLHFCYYLEYQTPDKFGDYELLFGIQKIFGRGYVWQKLLSATMSQYNDRKKQKTSYGEYQIKTSLNNMEERIEYLLQILQDPTNEDKSSESTKKTKSGLKYDYKKLSKEASDDWSKDISSLIVEQRNMIDIKFNEYFKRTYNYSQRDDNNKGNVYIIIVDYSRAVRSILKKVISNESYKEVTLFFWHMGNSDMDFGIQLMRHQILKELNDEGGYDDTKIDTKTFNQRLLYGDISVLNSQLTKSDTAILLVGCDEISEDGYSAYTKYSPDIVNRISTLCGFEACIVGAAHKKELASIAHQTENKAWIEQINKFDKTRTKMLYKWTDCVIISSDHVRIPKDTRTPVKSTAAREFDTV